MTVSLFTARNCNYSTPPIKLFIRISGVHSLLRELSKGKECRERMTGFTELYMAKPVVQFLLTGFVEQIIVRLVWAYEEGGIRER